MLLIESGPDDLTYSCKDCGAKPFHDLHAGTPLIPWKPWFFEHVKDLRWDNTISMPSFWNYEKTILNRSIDVWRAKMLGGCLSHNGMVWTRGSVRDYDFVAQKLNLSDWSFARVLPYFQKLETYFGENKTLRGHSGPIEMREKRIQKWEHQLQALFDTAIEYGIPFNNHINGGFSQSGIGFTDTNVGQYKNNERGLYNTEYYRLSSSEAYVRKIGIPSGNLNVWTNTTVQRILLSEGTAVGVEYWTANDDLASVSCKHEVIVSAGAFQSPQLLMLSGIGPSEQLQQFGITPVYNLAPHKTSGLIFF